MTKMYRDPQGVTSFNRGREVEMSKHTPGPWVVSAKGIGGATVSEDANRKNHIACLVNKEDANLIAAAPTMLDALERLEYWFDVDQETLDQMSPDCLADHKRKHAMIRVALGKAKGNLS